MNLTPANQDHARIRLDRPVRVLVIGQTPPPYHGQSLMIELLLRSSMQNVRCEHVRLAYSTEVVDAGRPRFGKVLHLGATVMRALWTIARTRPDVVYYPPAGPNLVPVLRDIATLLAIRPFCARLVFHFHAGGISNLWTAKIEGTLLAAAFRRAFFGADAAIMLARANPPDGQTLQAKRLYFVPYGIDDQAAAAPEALDRRQRFGRPQILFVGAVSEPKGVLVLVRACVALWGKGCDFDLVLVGDCAPAFEHALRQLVTGHEVRLRLRGVLTGQDKWAAYASADVFCFPTHYDAETFGVVCLEAMMFGLPIVATAWRGVSEIVVEGETGHLVPIRDEVAVAARLESLLSDPEQRRAMGRAARSLYLRHFTTERYIAAMERVFVEVAAEP